MNNVGIIWGQNMLYCLACGHSNNSSATHCEKCKQPLKDVMKDTMPIVETLKTEREGLLEALDHLLKPENTPEQILPTEKNVLVFYFLKERLIVPFEEVITIGRQVDTDQLTVNLSPYDAHRLGVSRHHAEIRRVADHQFEIIDKGSSNGTFINGNLIPAHEPHTLHDGDWIRLGSFLTCVRIHV